MRVAVTTDATEWAARSADMVTAWDRPCQLQRREGVAVAWHDLQAVTDEVLIVPREEQPADRGLVAMRLSTNRITVFCAGPALIEAHLSGPWWGPRAVVQDLSQDTDTSETE